MNNKNNFAQGSISANILSLAIPMTLAQLKNHFFIFLEQAKILFLMLIAI